MARSKSEEWSSTDQEEWGAWDGMFCSPAGGLGSAVSCPVHGIRAKPRRPGDLERFIGLKPNSINVMEFGEPAIAASKLDDW